MHPRTRRKMKKINLNRPYKILYDLIIILISALIILVVLYFAWFVTFRYVPEGYYEIQDIEIQNIQEPTATEEKELTQQDYVEMRQKEVNNLNLIDDEMIRFIKYKGVCFKYEEMSGIKENVTEKLHNSFTYDEIYLMQRVIETECYQQDFMSKVNVASVILNRLNNEKFDDSIEEIIKSPNQFAYGRRYITYDTILALEYATYYGDTTNGALYFHSNTKTDRFNGKSHIFTDDAGHHFYG